MRVVVTGATGNVGTSLLRALARIERVETILGVGAPVAPAPIRENKIIGPHQAGGAQV